MTSHSLFRVRPSNETHDLRKSAFPSLSHHISSKVTFAFNGRIRSKVLVDSQVRKLGRFARAKSEDQEGRASCGPSDCISPIEALNMWSGSRVQLSMCRCHAHLSRAELSWKPLNLSLDALGQDHPSGLLQLYLFEDIRDWKS